MWRFLVLLQFVFSLVLVCGSPAFADSVSFKSPSNVELKGSLTKPNGNGPYPAIVLLHTCGGIMKHVSEDWPKFLNGLGFAVLTVDSFGSRGLGKCPNGLRHREMRIDAIGAYKFLKKQDFIDRRKIGVFGFSKGGIVANQIAGDLHEGTYGMYKLAVSFYGNCKELMGAEGAVEIPMVQIFGEYDTEAANCAKLKSTPQLKIVKLPGAYHNFDVEESSGRMNSLGTQMEYSAEATAKAREIVKSFLAQHF